MTLVEVYIRKDQLCDSFSDYFVGEWDKTSKSKKRDLTRTEYIKITLNLYKDWLKYVGPSSAYQSMIKDLSIPLH